MENKPSRKSARFIFASLLLGLTLCCFGAFTDAAELNGTAGAEAEQLLENNGTEYSETMLILTFRMGVYGEKTVTVPKGEIPAYIPVPPQSGSEKFLGWYDANGVPADFTVPAVKSAVYTARWSRKVGELLNNTDHFAYIKGYSDGTFRPDQNVSRAEAAQMVYTLLRSTDHPRRSFSDTGGQWFTDAVETMAGIGVLNGYSDGTFRPNQFITRAEFVTMAVSCDTLTAATASFKDVPAGYWAAPYIACASSKGWISGYSDGTFRPENRLTRAEAVAILNRMLGRTGDLTSVYNSDVKGFYDVFPNTWSYGAILEASTGHTFAKNGTTETWTSYKRDTTPARGGWMDLGGQRYYVDPVTRRFFRGPQTINGKPYMFDSTTGAGLSGFYMADGWRRYFVKGEAQEDISNRGLVTGPYFIKVYKNANYLIIFARDEKGEYNTPVKAMRTSCGYATITGTYYTPARYRWLKMIGNSYAQWCTQIQGNYLFHSVPNWTYSNTDLEVEEYNHLGETRSLGCIRLNCRDAKWIFDNCALGTRVYISPSETEGPLKKPLGIQIPAWHTWDPTDPTAAWLCKEKGCH